MLFSHIGVDFCTSLHTISIFYSTTISKKDLRSHFDENINEYSYFFPQQLRSTFIQIPYMLGVIFFHPPCNVNTYFFRFIFGTKQLVCALQAVDSFRNDEARGNLLHAHMLIRHVTNSIRQGYCTSWPRPNPLTNRPWNDSRNYDDLHVRRSDQSTDMF